MATTPLKEPPVLNLPNVLTAARLGLAVVLFVLISFGWWVGCVIVFAAAAVTDWLDGYIARKQGLVSAVGRNFDPLVDKVLICGAFIFLLPVPGAELAAWMVTLVVARELIITSLRSFFESKGANFGADWLGKIKMVLQCAALIAIFVAQEVPADSAASSSFFKPVQNALVYAMLVATALSGMQYLWRAFMVFKADS
jgi:CDP-diacylglycerol--glycerol-3-phosphate 3-phosphatidyltransferase